MAESYKSNTLIPNICRITIITIAINTNNNAYSTRPCPISENDNFIIYISLLIGRERDKNLIFL
jgi:hypothetical protein